MPTGRTWCTWAGCSLGVEQGQKVLGTGRVYGVEHLCCGYQPGRAWICQVHSRMSICVDAHAWKHLVAETRVDPCAHTGARDSVIGSAGVGGSAASSVAQQAAALDNFVRMINHLVFSGLDKKL